MKEKIKEKEMKKLQRILCVMLSMLLLTGATLSVGAVEKMSVKEDDTSNQTMGEIEREVIGYLNEYHPEITFGTEEYVEYLTEQLIDATDEQLKNRKDYEEICTYAAKYLTLIDEKQGSSLNDTGDLTLSSDEKNITLSEIEEEDREERAKVEQSNAIAIQNNVTQRTSSYNASNAIQYARKWAEGRNADYPKYSKDCTNFVSQAVFHGGISMKKPTSIPHGTNKTSTYWYSKKHKFTGSTGQTSTEYDVSSSWINVEGFFNYAKNHGGSVIQCASLSVLQDKCRPGDIVQLYHKGGWFHSIIITGGKKGDRAYCGHTSNRKDRRVLDIDGATKYRIIRF